MAKEKKSNNPAGRPSTGLSTGKVLVTMPPEMLELVTAAAKAEGVSRQEWIRRAMRVHLARSI